MKHKIMHLQPSVIGEVVHSGYFDPSFSERVLHLTKRMLEYNTKISAFLDLLSEGSTAESSIKDVVLRVVQNLEELRKEIVEECALLIQHPETRKHLANRVSNK